MEAWIVGFSAMQESFTSNVGRMVGWTFL